MIVLYTDFGTTGPYVGQMKAVLAREAPAVPVIDLMHDAPAFDPRAAAYLLAALTDSFPEDCVFLCVVDPGVGGARAPAIATAGRRRFVGPDNGLFEIAMRRTPSAALQQIAWRPARLSASFHGRDLFAPVAARLARGETVDCRPAVRGQTDWPDDLREVIYVDGYGNAMTGLRASAIPSGAVLEIAGRRLRQARTFSDLPPGAPFWYENSAGLVEFAAGRASAASLLGIGIGAPFSVDSPDEAA